MAIVVTVIGVLLIAAALIDVYQTLFHPTGRGAMSDWTAKLTWRTFRFLARKRPQVLTYAGPTAILLIIVSWAGLTWLGFALIYLPQLANGFEFSHAAGGSAHQGIVEALSVSLGALITLSEGSYAKLHWLQLARGTEAVIGFGLGHHRRLVRARNRFGLGVEQGDHQAWQQEEHAGQGDDDLAVGAQGGAGRAPGAVAVERGAGSGHALASMAP